MKHEILFLGKTKDRYLQQGIDDFRARLSHYTKINITTLKDPATGKAGGGAREMQGKLILKAVNRKSMKIALDSRGKQMSSEEFSRLISRWEMTGIKHISYLIGGPEGHGSTIIDNVDYCLSLSKMTFTHDMVRLLLLEQIYRAYTIKAGEKYHK